MNNSFPVPWFIKRRNGLVTQYLKLTSQWNGSRVVWFADWIQSAYFATEFVTKKEAKNAIETSQDVISALGGPKQFEIGRAAHW